jgi:hypothetical protein
MIGTTRARVSFFMNKFRKLGFIEYNGQTGSPYFLVEHGFVRQVRDQKRELGSPFQLPVTSMNRASGWPLKFRKPSWVY